MANSLRSRWWPAVVAWLLFAPASLALDPRLSLAQYVHTSWTQSEGALIPGIDALAQTADGYLWLGTWQGLWRFDGLRFTRWTPAAGERLADKMVTALAASATGGLWIGAPHGLQRLEQGHLNQYTGRYGLTQGMITALWQDAAGRLWLGAAQSNIPVLSVLDGNAVTVLQKAEVLSFSVEADGAIRANTVGGFYVCGVSDRRYLCKPEAAGFERDMARQSVQWKSPANVIRSVLRDRDGNVWIGTLGHGLYLFRHGSVERFSRLEGLSSDEVEALLEDREGNIWVGTSNGIDRFRDPKVARWSTMQGLAGNYILAVCATRAGDLWVSSMGGGLDRLRGERARQYGGRMGLGKGEVLSIFEDSGQTLWAATTQGVLRLSQDRFVPVPTDPRSPFNRVLAMAEDGAGTVWLADAKQGLGKLQHGSIAKTGVADVAVSGIYQMSATRKGDLWIGYYQGGVAVVSRGSVHRFTSQAGLAGGTVQAIFEDRAGSMWIGTSEGLSRYRNGSWTTWTARQGIPEGGVQAVIEDGAARLWLITRAGIAPLADAGSETRSAGVPPRLTLATYGSADGIRMREVAGRINPRVTMTADGRMWFGTEDGLASIDPASIRINHVPPPVGIEELVVDGKRTGLPERGTQIRGRSIEVEYTALSLTSPETVRFRYKLEPVNQEWVDAGATRRMAYVNLQPGHYQFRVTACNNDGEWNRAGARLAFTIDPRFYQTWWFAILCGASLVMAGYGVHLGKVHRLHGRFRLILQERTRLTRELHDTLLQGFAGVVYQLEAASRQMAANPQAGKQRLEKALEQADQSLREARQMLSCMRLSALENRTLAEALRAAGEQIADGTPIRFELAVRGKARELPYEVQACLYIIAREAMNNAASHAQPDRIALALSYGVDQVSLTVRDTGKGFDVESAESKPDHWGLAGMRERAAQAGGSLRIQSSPDRGTTVEIIVEKLSKKTAAQAGLASN